MPSINSISSTGDDYPQRKSLIRSLAVLVCLSAFTVDVSIVALTDIGQALHVSNGETHLIISSYVISLALAQIPLGFISEKIGRLNTLYLGLTIFTAGGLIATFSYSFEGLLAGRFIQGIGGACGPVMARCIARDISSGKELHKMMALFVSALAISTMIAPIIGSLLLTVFEWQSVFAITLVMGLVCFGLTARYIVETKPDNLSSSGNFKKHWRVYWSNSNAVIGSIMLGLLFFGYLTFISSFSTIASDQFALSSEIVGWYFALFVSFYLLGSYLSQQWLKHNGGTRLLDIACFLLFIAIILFSLLLHNDAYIAVGIIGVLTYLLAMGCLFGVAATLAMKGLSDIAGTASGIMGTVQMLLGFMGTLVGSIFYSGNMTSTLAILAASSLLILLVCLFSKNRLV